MEKEKQLRINELARKAKTEEGLTPEELEEQKLLREEYIAEWKRSMGAMLENTVIEYSDGSRKSLKKDK